MPTPHDVVLCLGETMAMLTTRGTHPVETAEDFTLDIGGAESNVACHLANLGHRAAWFGAVGTDPLGRRVLDRLASAGVDVSLATQRDDAPTGLYVKDPGAGVTYYRRGSAASRLGPDDLASVAWSGVRLLHLSGITTALSPSNRALVHAAMAAAKAHGVTVSFDVNHRPALWASTEDAAAELAAAARLANVVFVGRDEAETVWGTTTAASIRADLFPRTPLLVVKDSDVAAHEFGPDGDVSLPAPVVDVVEPVGAGDAFAAGWLDAFLRGAPASERLARGHARAALALGSVHDVPLQNTTTGADHDG